MCKEFPALLEQWKVFFFFVCMTKTEEEIFCRRLFDAMSIDSYSSYFSFTSCHLHFLMILDFVISHI